MATRVSVVSPFLCSVVESFPLCSVVESPPVQCTGSLAVNPVHIPLPTYVLQRKEIYKNVLLRS